jgi:hypothetical protein
LPRVPPPDFDIGFGFAFGLALDLGFEPFSKRPGSFAPVL